MKVKKIYVEAKKSHNFQTYTVGLEVEFDKELPIESEELDVNIRHAQNKCRRYAVEQINVDNKRGK